MPLIASFFIVFAVGAIIGSFIGSLSYRLPKAILEGEHDILKAISTPRSYCPNCHQPIRKRDLIPVFSWIFTGQKASCCGAKISIRYPLIEATMAALTLYGYAQYGMSAAWLASVCISFLALTLFVTDIETLLLPDQLTLGGIWPGLLFCWYLSPNDLAMHVWGVVLGYSALWTIFQIHFRLTGNEGMGYGDFKLLAMYGGWSGVLMLPLTLLLASIFAILSYPLLKKGVVAHNGGIPFGPALCIAGWIMYHFGDSLFAFLYGA